jgi:G:T-mismatch repair DNA endonuclease (very short patch repair protein)
MDNAMRQMSVETSCALRLHDASLSGKDNVVFAETYERMSSVASGMSSSGLNARHRCWKSEAAATQGTNTELNKRGKNIAVDTRSLYDYYSSLDFRTLINAYNFLALYPDHQCMGKEWVGG